MNRYIFMAIAILLVRPTAAQTAASLFWRTDSLQITELYAPDNSLYKKVGHHGPAVENRMMGLRIYFSDTGAIDVYSKSGKQMELLKYKWYPTKEQMAEEGAGCDEYFVGKSLGLGGINLWDAEKAVKMSITKGRRAVVGSTLNGHFAEVIAYGVPYRGDFVDISIRIDVADDSRDAEVTARCLNGKKVQFTTGVNYNKGAELSYGKGYIAAWGVHPANVSTNPIPLGGGMRYDTKVFPTQQVEENMVRLISVPAVEVRTRIVSASTKEKELDSSRCFSKYVRKLSPPKSGSL